MKAKKFYITLLVIASLMVPFSLISFSYGSPHLSAYDINWGVTEGRTYTWVVKESNTTLGFLPVDSKFKITVTSIRSMNDGDATELNATITQYNSLTLTTITILNDSMFIYFNAGTNTTSFYAPIYEHGFFIPINYNSYFYEGLRDYFRNYSAFDSYGSAWYYDTIHSVNGFITSSDLRYAWVFNDNLITRQLFVAYFDDVSNEIYQYRLELQGSDGAPDIPYGNIFLIFTGLAILSLIYIYKKRVK